MDAADTLYLQPRDFTGTPQALDTPEGFYPTTGVNSLTADTSEAQGVPSDDVHFVLVGDTAAPNGGLLERFDLPGFPSSDLAVPSFGVTFGDPTPDDLSRHLHPGIRRLRRLPAVPDRPAVRPERLAGMI